MLELIDISYGYKKNEDVLSNINFKVNKGECWGILGHNGAGKTTLSYIIMKLLYPRSGSILNNGCDYDYLPEFGGYYNNLTVLQNFNFKMSLNQNEIAMSAEDLIKKLGLSNCKQKLARNLSQGQKKRLAIGLVIISDRDLIYLDEPTNGLDPEILIFLRDYIIELKKTGKTILINSHNLSFINDVSTNILILNQGKIVYKDAIDKNIIEDIYFEKVGVLSENNV